MDFMTHVSAGEASRIFAAMAKRKLVPETNSFLLDDRASDNMKLERSESEFASR
jgi:hypothetical protein